MNKIALIGNGYWGSKIKKYIPEFFELKYVADSKFNRNIIWQDKEIDSVIIATPIDTHYELCKEAIINNKNVLIEKPITLKYNEAIELIDLSNQYNVKVVVEYTQMFSKGIEIIKGIDIGDIKYIEMSTKHLGRFLDFDVYWLLASHHLSVLSMFYSLDKLNYIFKDILFHKDICTTGTIYAMNKEFQARIDVSLNYSVKDFCINIYGSNGFTRYNPLDKFAIYSIIYDKLYKKLPNELIKNEIKLELDESNNLRNAIKYFKDVIDGRKETNIKEASQITKILERN